MSVIEDRYHRNRMTVQANRGKKNRQKNRQMNGQKNGRKNRPEAKMASLPVKTAISADKGSDLLLLCSNNPKTAVARPQLLREGETIYLRQHRRTA